MVDPERAGVSREDWSEATSSCHELRVARTIAETHDATSIVLEIPPELKEAFRYRAGQFLSFKVPYEGHVLVRSYSLASSPDTDPEHKVTVKRVREGRISNWMHDVVRKDTRLMVVPPAGRFVIDEASPLDLTLFSAGSGITPCIAIVKSALATTQRRCKLVYANRDERSIIFRREIDSLQAAHPGRLEIVHSLDDTHGFVGATDVEREVEGRMDTDFYLCGPAAFMDIVEQALQELGFQRERLFIERFISPPDPDETRKPAEPAADTSGEGPPASITVVIDGKAHSVPYEPGERVLSAARRAGLDPPFSCEEGYCSCCMAKIVEGKVSMAANDCLTPDLLEQGWVLTCQSHCTSSKIRIEYPD